MESERGDEVEVFGLAVPPPVRAAALRDYLAEELGTAVPFDGWKPHGG